MPDNTKYISRIQVNSTYDLRDRRIPKTALDSANVGDIVTVALDGNNNKIMTPQAPAAQGLVLGDDVITQAGVDVTSGVKSALDMDLKADLVNGKVPSNQLPSFVDSVVEGYYYNNQFYRDAEHTQLITPETGKIYVDLPTNKTYRWGGSIYVEISSSLTLGETESTAYRGDRGKEAWQHSLIGKDSALTYSTVPDYDTTKSYVQGDVVKNGTRLYRCLNSTTGQFDPGAWTQTNPHNLTHRDLHVAATVNGEVPDLVTGNVVINRVPFAENLYSIDNDEDIDTYVFRTTGGSASLETGEANLGTLSGTTIVTELPQPDTHHKSLLNIAKPSTFQSLGLNAFNVADTTSVLRGYTVIDGAITNGTENDVIAIIHAVGGVVAGNGNTGYTAAWLESENTSIDNVEHVLQAAWFIAGTTKPSVGTTGLTELTNTTGGGLEWVDDEYGYRAALTFGNDNGYLVLVTNASYSGTSFGDKNVTKLCVHPRWSGYMDGTPELYSASTIAIPTTHTSGQLPTASYGFPSLELSTGEVIRDVINFQDLTYKQYVGRYVNDGHGANIAIVAAITNEYIYDETNILYQLPTPATWTLSSAVSGLYTANDFGTEEFIYSNSEFVPITAQVWYGQNLRDKLRTDVVTISPMSLTNSQKEQVRTSIGAIAEDSIGAPNGVAGLDSNGKVIQSQLPSYVKSVNNESPDVTGNVTLTTIPLAENLLSPDNDSDTGTYIFRTAGGEASLSDGEAALTTVKGYTSNPTKADESFTITVQDVNEGTPFTVAVNSNTWMQNTVVGWTPGTYTFEYDLTNTRWTVTSTEAGLAGTAIVLADCGLSILSGTVADHDKIVVNYTRTNSATGGVESHRVSTVTIVASTYWAKAIDAGFGKPNINPIAFTYVSTSDDWTAVQEQLEYSSTSTYEIGDVVKYKAAEVATYSTYTCNTRITTPEVWDISHWTLKTAETSVITVTGQAIADYGITLSASAYNDDVVTVTSSYDTSTSTPSASGTFTPHCFIQFTVDQAMLNVWFSSTSAVRNLIGPQGVAGRFEFIYDATDAVWNVTIGETTTPYTKSALRSTFGIDYTIESSSPIPYPQAADLIWVRPSILADPQATEYDYVGPNTFSVSFGTGTAEIAANKAKWRAEIDAYGTNIYRFTRNEANELWTLAIMDSTGEVVTQQITTTASLTTYGLVLEGEAGRKDYITVNYVKEVLGSWASTTPTAFKSVGTQQWNPANVFANYRINAAGTAMEAATGYYVAYVHACYANAQGWTIYSPGSKLDSDGTTAGTRISWCATLPTTSSTLETRTVREDQGGDTYDTAGSYTTGSLTSLSNFYFEDEAGYIVISLTANPANDLMVHPRWSGYKNLTSGYATETAYATHTTTITLPTTGVNTMTQQTESLPLGIYGMPAVGSVADEMQVDRARYIKNIERVQNTPQNMAMVIALGTDFIYDANYIYYVLLTPVIYSITINGTYIVCDFGTEEFTGTTLPVTATTLYGQNLRDKLRTDVVTISAQTLNDAQKAQVRTNIGALGSVNQGTASTFGVVKLSDNYTSSAGAASASMGASSTAVYNAYNTLRTDLNYVNYLVGTGSNVSVDPNHCYHCTTNKSAAFTLTLNATSESSTKANEWHYIFYNSASSDFRVTLAKTSATFYTPDGYKTTGSAYLTATKTSYCEISVLRIGTSNNYLANICCYPNTALA